MKADKKILFFPIFGFNYARFWLKKFSSLFVVVGTTNAQIHEKVVVLVKKRHKMHKKQQKMTKNDQKSALLTTDFTDC